MTIPAEPRPAPASFAVAACDAAADAGARVDHHHPQAPPRQPSRRLEPGHAGADHDYIVFSLSPSRHWWPQASPRRRVCQPPGRRRMKRQDARTPRRTESDSDRPDPDSIARIRSWRSWRPGASFSDRARPSTRVEGLQRSPFGSDAQPCGDRAGANHQRRAHVVPMAMQPAASGLEQRAEQRGRASPPSPFPTA